MIQKFLLLILLALFTFGCQSKQSDELKEVSIALPTAKCETCKSNIETKLKSVVGIRSAIVSEKDPKFVKVSFNPGKTSEAKIRTAISEAGYDADSVKRTVSGYEDLQDCCK